MYVQSLQPLHDDWSKQLKVDVSVRLNFPKAGVRTIGDLVDIITWVTFPFIVRDDAHVHPHKAFDTERTRNALFLFLDPFFECFLGKVLHLYQAITGAV